MGNNDPKANLGSVYDLPRFGYLTECVEFLLSDLERFREKKAAYKFDPHSREVALDGDPEWAHSTLDKYCKELAAFAKYVSLSDEALALIRLVRQGPEQFLETTTDLESRPVSYDLVCIDAALYTLKQTIVEAAEALELAYLPAAKTSADSIEPDSKEESPTNFDFECKDEVGIKPLLDESICIDAGIGPEVVKSNTITEGSEALESLASGIATRITEPESCIIEALSELIEKGEQLPITAPKVESQAGTAQQATRNALAVMVRYGLLLNEGNRIGYSFTTLGTLVLNAVHTKDDTTVGTD